MDGQTNRQMDGWTDAQSWTRRTLKQIQGSNNVKEIPLNELNFERFSYTVTPSIQKGINRQLKKGVHPWNGVTLSFPNTLEEKKNSKHWSIYSFVPKKHFKIDTFKISTNYDNKRMFYDINLSEWILSYSSWKITPNFLRLSISRKILYIMLLTWWSHNYIQNFHWYYKTVFIHTIKIR